MEVAIAIAVASLLAYGQVREGLTQSAILKKQAEEAEREGQLALRQAKVERQQAEMNMTEADIEKRKGEIQVNLQREKAEKILGEHRARLARAGVSFTGSPLEYLGDEAARAEYDRELIRYEAGLKSWEKSREGTIRLDRAKLLEAEAPMYNVQASIYRRGAKEAKIGGYLRGFGTLAMTAGTLGKAKTPAPSSDWNWGGYAPGDPTFGRGTPY